MTIQICRLCHYMYPLDQIKYYEIDGAWYCVECHALLKSRGAEGTHKGTGPKKGGKK